MQIDHQKELFDNMRLGAVGKQKLEDFFALDESTKEKVDQFYERFKWNVRCKKLGMQTKRMKQVLGHLYTFFFSIYDINQRIRAQLYMGLVAVSHDYNFFIVWVDRLKTLFGSHTTINTLLNSLGCIAIHDSQYATWAKAISLPQNARWFYRNLSVRVSNGIFDKYFSKLLTPKPLQLPIQDMSNKLENESNSETEPKSERENDYDDEIPCYGDL